MTLKGKLMLSAVLVAFVLVNNCASVGHDATMRTELAIKSDKHINLQRPIEVTHDVQDKLLTGEATGMILWIPFVFDVAVQGVAAASKVVAVIPGALGGALGGLPVVGKKIEDGAANLSATIGNVGPVLNNALVLLLANEAESKAVYENNIDGFYRTGVHAEIGIKWLIFKEYKVQVTGKPIVIKSLGQFSDARLAKLQGMAAKASCATCADVK